MQTRRKVTEQLACLSTKLHLDGEMPANMNPSVNWWKPDAPRDFGYAQHLSCFPVFKLCQELIRNSTTISPFHLPRTVRQRFKKRQSQKTTRYLSLWTLGALQNPSETQLYLRQAPLLCSGRDFVGISLQHSSILLTVFLVLCPGIAFPERPVYTHL